LTQLTPPPTKVFGVIPLRGLQLVCCAVAAGLVLHASVNVGQQTDPSAIAASLEPQLDPTAAPDAGRALAEAVQIIVKRNDTLDRIFRQLRLSLGDLADIRALDEARHALDRIRPGELLTFFKRGDQLVGLQRSLSVRQTLKVERDASDRFTATVEEVPLVRQVASASASINSSLFAAGSAAGLRDPTLSKLADIFRWDVDFVLDLRAGDSFTVVYERFEKDGEVVEEGDILAAEFINDGKRYRAIRYTNRDGQADYYTPEGTSLRKAFLKAPVQFSRISSVFNPNRRHPVLNTIRAHRGVDYAAPTGTAVQAAGAGRVQFRGVKGGFGNLVEIAHAGGVVTRYGHLSSFAPGIKAGQRVEQGQFIGRVGMTGLATGPHLHFEYIERGTYIDPQKAMRRATPGTPVSATERMDFERLAAPLLARLDAEGAHAATLAAR
jgi:murein DD-endopeptidase MepM/ murein hydrolase activator NlpD